MNKILLIKICIYLCFFSVKNLHAQHSCGTPDLHRDIKNEQVKHQIEEQIQLWIQSNSDSRSGEAPLITIPVVVHVIHNGEPIGTGSNLSDAQIIEQIDILNKDFRALNADSLHPGHPFYNLRGDTRIEFCLASRDPFGYITSGITRIQGGQNMYTIQDDIAIKSTLLGGRNGWNPYQYLNIWTVNPNPISTILGWAYTPENLEYFSQWDGVVVASNAFGISSNNLPNYNSGRVLTHEVGHWLNLIHTWGDENSSDCLSDLVDDTPPALGPNFGCPDFPHRPNNICGSNENGEMFMNYMDYTNGSCMNMFSVGQSERMMATINTVRSSLLNSQGCVPSLEENPLSNSMKWYVDKEATGSGNGLDWNNAITDLQVALNFALDYGVREIWVKKGTYKPTTDDNKAISFNIPSSVKVYGGFAGTESLLNERNQELIHTTNATILTGDLQGDDNDFDNTAENSHTVVKFYIAPNTTRLDGFIIRGGNNRPTPNSGWGAGINNNGACQGHESNPVLANCLITYNNAYQGAGLYNHGAGGGKANMTIENCTFTFNRSMGTLGGAILNDGVENGEASPIISNTKFISNNSGAGGAVYNMGIMDGKSDPVFTNCLFEKNDATFGYGGAIYNMGSGIGDGTSGNCNPTFINCEFKDNKSIADGGSGGVIFNDADNIGNVNGIYKNCIFYNNFSTSSGAVVRNSSSNNGICSNDFINCTFNKNNTNTTIFGTAFVNFTYNSSISLNFKNCILFDNGSSNVIRNNKGLVTDQINVTINNSLIDDKIQGFSGENNVVSTFSPFVSDVDLTLRNCSSALDIGDNAFLNGLATDLLGNPRTFNSIVDAGAYESQSNVPVENISFTRGKAISFNGTNANVETVNVLSPKTSNLTLETWVKVTNYPSSTASIFYHGEISNNGYGLSIDNSGTLYVQYGESIIENTGYTANLNEWMHLALRIDDSKGEVFVNGHFLEIINGLPTEPKGKLIIGGFVGNYFNGEIDELRFWDVALSETQIRERMHLIMPEGTSNLKNYLQFNEVSSENSLIDGMGCALSLANNTTLVNSGANVSKGVSYSVNNPSTQTNIEFTGTNLILNFGNSPSSGQIVVSRLEGKPTGNQVSSSYVFEDHYWVVNNFCENKTGLDITAQITLGSGNIVSQDETNPNQVKFNQRNVNSEATWDIELGASNAVSTSGLVIFENIDFISEFVISNTYAPIIVSQPELTPFISCAGFVSEEQTYTVSASDLTTDLMITAPTGFEISQTSGTGFTTSISLTPSAGIVNSTTIYVRQMSSATSELTGDIVHVSAGQYPIKIEIPVSSVNEVSIEDFKSIYSINSISTSFDITFENASCNPTQYSVHSVSPTILDGFSSIINETFTSSPLTIPLPDNLVQGTYHFVLTISNEGSSQEYPFIVNVLNQSLAERRGKALKFNGSNFSSTNSVLSTSKVNVTLESWIKLEQTPIGGECQVIHNGGYNDGYGFIISNTRQLMLNYGSWDRYQTSHYFDINRWYHVALSIHNNIAFVYVDGVQVLIAPISTSNPTNNFIIGGRPENKFYGEVDEVRLWNTARTLDQIRENMHLTLPNGANNLINYFQFNEENPSNFAFDNVSGNNLNVSGAIWVESQANVSNGTSFTVSNPSIETDYEFTGTNLTLNFGNSIGTGNVVVSRLDGLPIGSQITTDINVYDNRYWIVHNFGTNNSNLDITAKVNLNPENITETEQTTPGLVLFTQREATLGLPWSPSIGASEANSSSQIITFNSLSTIKEFAVGKSLLLLPTVNISSNDADNYVPSGATITFTAVTTHTGETPNYQWKINGFDVGTNSPTFATDNLQNNDVVSVVFSTTGEGIMTHEITSNEIIIKTYSFEFNTLASKTDICLGDNSELSTSILINGHPINNTWISTPINLNSYSGVGSNVKWFNKIYVSETTSTSKLWLDLLFAPAGNVEVKLALYSADNFNNGTLIAISDAKNNLQANLNYFNIPETVLNPGYYFVGFASSGSINFKTSNTVEGYFTAIVISDYSVDFPNSRNFVTGSPNQAYGFGITVPEPSISWSPSDFLSSTTGSVVQASPTETTNFVANFVDEYGNTRTSERLITVNIPTITSSSPSTRCGLGEITISATPSLGSLQWFTTETGGEALTSNSDYDINEFTLTVNNLTETKIVDVN
jgi:hypothetical protein